MIYGGVFLFILASKSSTFVTEGDWQETCSSIGIVAQMTNSYLKIFRFLIDLYLGISKRPSRKIPVATEMGWGQDLKVRFPYLTIWTFPEDPTGLNFYWGNIGVFREGLFLLAWQETSHPAMVPSGHASRGPSLSLIKWTRSWRQIERGKNEIPP